MSKTPKLRFHEFSGAWEEKKLKEYAEKVNKKNKDFAITNVISNSAKNGLISQRDFFEKDIANQANINGYYVIETGDFVYNPRKSAESPYGPVNRYNLYESGVVSPLYLCFKINKSMDGKFLEYYFKSDKWYRYIYLNSDQGARHDRVSIKDSEVFNLDTLVPQLEEQQKIANFFSLIDKKIEKQQEKVEALKDYKKGMMQKIFSQEIRFKGDNGEDYPEWEEKKLGEIGGFYRGHSYSATDVVKNGLLVLRSNNIKNNNITLDSDLQFVSKMCKEDIKLKENDIVICMANGSRNLVGKSGEYKSTLAYQQVTVGAFCSIYRTDNKIAKYLFQLNYYYKYLDILLSGTNINNLKNAQLELLSFMIPSIREEQQKIADFLSTIDKKIEKGQEKLDSLNQWKKGLLQQMFV